MTGTETETGTEKNKDKVRDRERKKKKTRERKTARKRISKTARLRTGFCRHVTDIYLGGPAPRRVDVVVPCKLATRHSAILLHGCKQAHIT